ncbi:hypothetical protein Bpfe_027007, partial [Biomphalaria pfeifferi]
MERLLFISRFQQEIEINKLKELADKYFEGNEVLMNWRDPYNKSRIVLKFQEPLDTEASIKSHYEAWKNESLVFCVEKPTPYLFIQSYSTSIFGLIDKLTLLFMKKLRTTIVRKTPLEDSCFKFEFKDGWDVVLKACEKKWKVNETEISVCPFFESFQEHYDHQWHRLKLEMINLSEPLMKRSTSNDTKLEEGASIEKDVTLQNRIGFIFFTNCLISEILVRLNIKGALDHNCQLININEKGAEIFGLKTVVRNICKVIADEDKQINLKDEEIKFLTQKTVLDEIEKQNHQIQFCESSMLVEKGSQCTERFADYVNNLVITKMFDCGEIDPELITYRDSFNKEHSFCQIVFLEGKLIFMCLNYHSGDVDILDYQIKETLKNPSVKNTTNQPDEKVIRHKSTEKMVDEILILEYSINTYQYEYCTMFIQELKKGKDVTDIRLLPNKLIVSFKPFTSDYSITSFQKYLDSIQHQETILEYQGLSQFAKLNQGREIISEISKSTQCCILVFDKLNLLREAEVIETEDYDYKAILLFTAHCGSLKIHLLQGHIEDIKTQMSVGILPAQNGEISLERSISQHYNLLLPPWSLREEDPDFLDKLRSSFKKSVGIIFKQAVHLGYSNIALSLENIHDDRCSFPLDLVAKTIYEQLFEALYSDMGATSTGQELDVYICDSDHESVFIAFKYYIKNFSYQFGLPDQEKWDHISFKNTSKYVEYSSNVVEITSTTPSWAPVFQNNLFCYPILPTLELFTSPILSQSDVSHDHLKREIQNFEDSNPDGIPENGYFPVRYLPYKDVIIYCCPDWGPNADEAIYRSLKVCLYEATNKAAVYIVPPGMERTSKYPAKYLAQAMFKALDKLYNKISKRLKIVFVVDKKEYEKAFNDELKKRTPSTAKSYTQRLSSSFQS